MESTNERRIKGIYKWTKDLWNLQMNEGFMESTNERRVRYARSYAAIEGIYKWTKDLLNLNIDKECGTHAATLLLKESKNERRI